MPAPISACATGLAACRHDGPGPDGAHVGVMGAVWTVVVASSLPVASSFRRNSSPGLNHGLVVALPALGPRKQRVSTPFALTTNISTVSTPLPAASHATSPATPLLPGP